MIPANELASIVDNIGLPVSGINITYGNSGTIGNSDADVLISLNEEHGADRDYIKPAARSAAASSRARRSRSCRPTSSARSSTSACRRRSTSRSSARARRTALSPNEMLEKLRHVPGLVDLRIQQTFNQPELRVITDRSRAQELGFSQNDVANNLLLTLSGSGQISPTFWLNPKTGVPYPIVVQTPQYRMDSLADLQNVPITARQQQRSCSSGLASITRGYGASVVSHYDAQPVIDIFGAVQGRDLGAVAKEINKIDRELRRQAAEGHRIVALRGQMQTMEASYTGLFVGLAGAILLVYLLIVINFQSWLDPFIIITALPAAIAGIAWMLLITGTTLSVPALTGAIMCMGVATANSILMVSFARGRMEEGATAQQAATEAGFTRFRPVLMTALAMIIGMLPMALRLGEGGEQNAPLGRAVIGGLLFATCCHVVLRARRVRCHPWPRQEGEAR